MMKKILVPYDGSESAKCAAKTAILLAEKFDSEITIITVVNVTPAINFYGEIPAIAQDYLTASEYIKKSVKAYSEEKLKELIQELDFGSIKTDTLVVEGLPDDEIIKKAADGNYDIIVMGRRGLNPVKRLFLGSISQKVLAHSPCSVLIEKGNC